MKTILVSIILLSVMNASGQHDSYKVPTEWDKAFRISIENTNSQYGNWSNLIFTHELCTYKANPRQRIKKDKFVALSQQERDEILAKLRELKIETIQEKNTAVVQRGGWSNILCLADRCIDGGSVSEMSDTDKELFMTACKFLQDFARKKFEGTEGPTVPKSL